MADISSITLPGGGTYDLKDKNAIPRYGKGINLFDNAWFTVNQRGVSSGTAVNAEYFLSRWVIRRASYSISGHIVTVTATANEYGIYQPMKLGTLVTGEKYTISADIDGEIKSLTFTMPSATGYVGYLSPTVRIYIQISAASANVWFTLPTANTSFTISKAKIEYGEESTLDGDVEPDYEEELIKCQTSTADPSDTYANKSLATEQQLAYVEIGTTASRAYAVGEYFCWNGLLYRAKTAISSGGTFTPGSNCEQVTEGGINAVNLVKDIGITYTENVNSFTPTAGTVITKKTWTVPRNMYVSIHSRTRFSQSGNGVVIGRINYTPYGGTAFLISQFQVGGGLSNVVVSPSCFLYAHTGDIFELQYYVETVTANTRCDGAVMCNLQSS